MVQELELQVSSTAQHHAPRSVTEKVMRGWPRLKAATMLHCRARGLHQSLPHTMSRGASHSAHVRAENPLKGGKQLQVACSAGT